MQPYAAYNYIKSRPHKLDMLHLGNPEGRRPTVVLAGSELQFAQSRWQVFKLEGCESELWLPNRSAQEEDFQQG